LLLGLLRVGGALRTPRRRRYGGSFAGLFIALGVYCVYGLTGRPLDSFTVAYCRRPDYGVGASAVRRKLEYLDTLEAGLARAKAENNRFHRLHRLDLYQLPLDGAQHLPEPPVTKS
jgi:hypothetical protein